MSALEKLYTTRDLADRYGRKPRAFARLASLGRIPSTEVAGRYYFTAEMVEWIDKQRERWPQNDPAPAAKQPKPQPVSQPRQRRTPQPPPPLAASNSKLRLVAKQRPNRIRRSA